MLVGQKVLSAHGVLFRATIILERVFRLYAVERSDNVVDSRFFRGPERLGGGTAVFFILLEGWIEWHDGREIHAPAAFFRGMKSQRTGELRATWSSGGEPYRALELILFQDVPVPDETAHLPLPEAAHLAAEVLYGDPCVSSTLAFLRSAKELLPPGLSLDQAVVQKEPAIVDAVWRAFLALSDSSSTFPSLSEFANISGFSLSHFTRYLRDWLVSFRFSWKGWRDLTNEARLRWATMLLSNPRLSIADVAKAAGYGSTETLDATFRRAGLPSPRDVRKTILDFVAERAARSSVPTQGPGATSV